MKRFLLLLLVSLSLSANSLGIVQKVDGIVKVKHKDSIKKSKIKKGDAILPGDILSTFRNSHAVLKLADGSDVVLDQRSVIAFEDALDFKQTAGKIFYKITSKDVRNKLKIKTDFAIIGIKGTTFIVSSEQNSSYVALKEGLIGIKSIKEEFQLYKKRVLSEYEAFVKRQQKEFEKFKKERSEYVVTMTKEFDLEAGKVVAFRGEKAIEDPLKDEDEFKSFEQMLQDQELKQVSQERDIE